MKHRLLSASCTSLVLSAVLVAFVPQTVCARMINPLLSPIPTDPQLTRGVLPNGLRYYVLPNKTPAKKVELRLIVRAGSLNETDAEQGLAHFMEHMEFNGTTRFPKHELTNQLEKMGVRFGADLNAYTGFGVTFYVLPVPTGDAANLPTAMKILEDWAFNATIADSEVESERRVIIEEWRLRTQNPEAQVMLNNIAVLAKGTMYPNREPIGKTDVIEHAKPELLRGFYKKWYRPDNMAVIMVGDVDAGAAVKMIEQHFGAHANPSTALVPLKNAMTDNVERLKSVSYHKDLPSNNVGWLHKIKGEAVDERSVGDYVLKFKRGLIDQMLNRRLNALLDSPKPPFIGAAAGTAELGGFVRGKWALHLHATASPHQQKQALTVLRDEAARVEQHGFTAAELKREVDQMLAHTQNAFNNRDKTNSADKAAEYIRGEVEGEALGSLAWENETQQRFLPRITLDDINALAKSTLAPDNQIVFVSGNDTTDALTEPMIDAVLNQTPTVSAYAETKNTAALLPSTPTAGKTIATQTNKSFNSTTWTLSNGVKVSYKITDFDDDKVVFIGSKSGGFSRLSNDAWRKSQWAFGGLSSAGVNGLSQTELSRLLSNKVVGMQLDANQTSTRLNGAFAPKDIKTAFELIHSMATRLNHNPDAFKGYLERGIGESANLANDRMKVFGDQVERDIWHNNPRFDGTYPTAAAWQATDYDAAYAAYQSALGNANGMTFSFVGKINPSELKLLSETYLGSLPSDLTVKTKWVDLKHRPDYRERTITVKKGKEPLSVVKIMFGGETAYDAKETLAMDAVGYVLKMRLMEQLRESQGGVYAVEAGGRLSKTPYGSFNFNIVFPCAPDKVEALTASALAELKKLMTDGPTAVEMDKFKQARRVAHHERLKKNAYWLTQLQKTTDDENTSPLTYETRLNALTAAQVSTLVQKYLNGNKVTAVLKPE